MEKLRSILVVIERDAPQHALRKACVLARHFGAKLELFLCDAERAYIMRQAYDRRGVAEARASCVADARSFLDALRKSVAADDIDIGIDAACESPLHEAIVHKALASGSDLVVKGLAPDERGRRASLTAPDWQLIRTCPVPLMLVRPHPWQPQPRFAAAIDVSEAETPGLARRIVHEAEYLSLGCGGILDIVHGAKVHPPRDTKDALARLASEFRIRAEGLRVVEGDPARALPQFVKAEQYDVVVMGALTHERSITATVGTLSGTLIESLECDFVLIKPETFANPLMRGLQTTTVGLTYGALP